MWLESRKARNAAIRYGQCRVNCAGIEVGPWSNCGSLPQEMTTHSKTKNDDDNKSKRATRRVRLGSSSPFLCCQCIVAGYVGIRGR